MIKGANGISARDDIFEMKKGDKYPNTINFPTVPNIPISPVIRSKNSLSSKEVLLED